MSTWSKTLCKLSSLILFAACASLIPLKVGPLLDVTIEPTPERLVRGEYLANNVNVLYRMSFAN